uniref:Uncharacterized protein n=1 Tax=Arundo donax TaxID=35708 RepID=A0A0A9DLN5_ARUDO
MLILDGMMLGFWVVRLESKLGWILRGINGSRFGGDGVVSGKVDVFLDFGTY